MAFYMCLVNHYSSPENAVNIFSGSIGVHSLTAFISHILGNFGALARHSRGADRFNVSPQTHFSVGCSSQS
ncbi:hypothetical protein ARMSODRAFT_959848 [Armillaria solidipes]|uniref:Uncharacterized protein n=1 Tax=Armillaria solidipes TaxID=1076256 RepID=A0A2H3BUI3_9AGAR|nr:hypothetical protein ARMSODRAFT_959848 [Armillaria solidipes]